MNEKWKDIKGYEGLYQVSNFGNIKSFYKNKILKPVIENTGYNQVTLVKNRKKRKHYIHRLVGFHFIDNPNNFNELNHKDGNKCNNCVENLEWCSRRYNVQHSVKILNKHCGKRKQVQCVETGEIFNSIKKAAKFYNIQRLALSNSLNNPNKTVGGLHWKTIL